MSETGDITAMRPEQEAHLVGLKAEVCALMDAKYRIGAHEHGNDLTSMTPKQLVFEGIKEAIDQLCYLLTAYEQMP
jgi:hypothetical protein